MFDFCLRGLGLTEREAKRRIDAARIVGRLPQAFEALASGAVCLSSFVLLKDVLTDDNVADVLARAAGKTQLEVGMIVASLAPKPDVPPSITELTSNTCPPPSATPTVGGSVGVGRPPTEPCHPPLTPLSPGRYKVELTGDEAFCAKIARALELTREENFSGDLCVMFDAALDVFIAHEEKKKRSKTNRPRASKGSKDPGAVTAAVRREVFARDDEQCTFVGTNGARCPARALLEIDHRHPRARGGDGTPENLRVLCAAHNRFEAERAYGADHVAKKIAERRARAAEHEPAPAPEPALGPRPPRASPKACIEGTRATVKAGLLRLGFRAKEIDAKLDAVAATEWERPLEAVMRDAIVRLTS